MVILLRKLLRDLWVARWQYLAVAAMVMLGVAFFNAAYAAYVNLNASYDRSYRDLDFEDFGITFHAAPRRVVDRIRRIPGVEAAEARLIEDVALEVGRNARSRKLVGRLITVPVKRESSVNRVKLVAGTQLTKPNAREVLLEASFAKHHKLRPGDVVEAVRGSSSVKLKIAGIVQSPEYLYVVRSKHELMAMPDTFGVMFVSEDVLGPLVGKAGQVNEVRVRLTDPQLQQRVMRQASSALAIYKPEEPVSREDQPSNQMLRQDVEGFQMYAILFPTFFLSVAALSVYTLLMRLVHEQRTVIGLLRSLGFSRSSVVRHYMAGALVVGLGSSLVGTLAGLWLAEWTSRSYMSMLQVPFEDIAPRPTVALTGVLIGTITCLVAGYLPSRMAARIKPAESMRPLIPTFGRSSVQLDRLIPRAPLLWRIPLRNILRQPRRTLSTLFGIIAGIALIMTARGLLDSTELAIDDMITGSYRYDLRLDFIRPQPGTVLNRVQSWPGVVRAEAILQVPIDLRHDGKTYSAMLSGQDPGGQLLRLSDDKGETIEIPKDGAVFGPTLRKRLGLESGAVVEGLLPEQMTVDESRPRLIRAEAFNQEAMGTVVYMPRAEVLRRFRGELELPSNALSTIVLKVAPGHMASVRGRLQDLPEAGSVLSVPEIRALVTSMLDVMRRFVWIMQVFGAALAFAMVFNMVMVNVLERSSEVATLRTIGVGRRQIALMVAAENLIVALFGIIIGLPIGRWFVGQFWLAAQTEEQQDLMTFNVLLRPSTYVIAALAVFIVAGVSLWPGLRLLGRLDLVKATKERSGG